MEEKLCKGEKQDILVELNRIRDTLRAMVTKNLTGSENEKIDLLEFYLDTETYNEKKTKNKDECKTAEINMKSLIVAQDKVTNHLKKNYLQTMGVPGKMIRAIFQQSMATNYVLLPPVLGNEKLLAWIGELRKVEQYMFSRGGFEPWLYMSKP